MEDPSWQSKLSCVRDRNLYAFNNSLFCDVEFSVVDSNGDRVTLQAHKYVLAISSPVFEAMFYGELAETGPTIDLPDCTKEGLQELLRYVYSDEVNLTGSKVMEVLYLAEKYMIPFLVQKCKEYLEKELEPEDVFIVLPQVKQLNDEKLEQHCWDIVDSKTEQTVSSEAFLNISHEMLCQFLGRDSLHIKEVELFQAVDKWVVKRIDEKGLENNGENKRAILGEEAIRLIRFPVMSQKEFAEVVLSKDLLKLDELKELVQIFNSVTPSTNIFSAQKRVIKSLIIPKSRFNKFLPPKTSWYYKDDIINAIDFTVDKVVTIVGVRLFGSQGSIYDVDLSIYKQDEIVSHVSSSFPTEATMIDDQYYGFTVTLNEPVKLDPGVRYTIAAKIKGPISYYGKDGQSVGQCKDLVVQYFRSKLKTGTTASDTVVASGQFATIIFE